MSEHKSPIDGILDELARMVGPKVTARTFKKIERAKAAFRRFEAETEALAEREAAKKDYVVTLRHPEHGEVKISRRTLSLNEAEAEALRLAPGFVLITSEIEKKKAE